MGGPARDGRRVRTDISCPVCFVHKGQKDVGAKRIQGPGAGRVYEYVVVGLVLQRVHSSRDIR